LQVTVFFITFQNTLAFKKPGDTVTDRVDKLDERFMSRRICTLKSCFAVFVFGSVRKICW